MKKGNPLVSIIVPNYNYARFLGERMNSIFNQTFTDYEVILLDDASTDGSCELLCGYATDERVSELIINEHNSGNPFVQWKKGFAHARGKYIWIAESDDSADVAFLEKSVRLLENNPSAVFCFSASVCIDENGNKIPKTDMDHWRRRRVVPGSYSKYDGRQFNLHCQYWCNHIYNASGVVLRNGGLECEIEQAVKFPHCGDWFFWSILSQCGDVILLHDRLNFFRRHSACVTSRCATDTTGLEEEMKLLLCFNDILCHPNAYKKLLRLGKIYKLIKTSGLSEGDKAYLRDKVKEYFGVGNLVYLFFKLNKLASKVCPLILTEKRDYIKTNTLYY